MEELTALLADRLTAAAEEICSCAERMRAERRTAEMSPEQRAPVHRRLSAVADEIFRILEIMMGEYEASRSHEEVEHRRRLLDITLKTHLHRTDRLSGLGSEGDISSEQQKFEHNRISSQGQKTSNLPQTKDASTETDSHLQQTQRAEKGTSAVVETETRGEVCVLPPHSQDVLSSNNSEGASEDNESDRELNDMSLKSNKRKLFLRQRQSAERCKTCGSSLSKGTKIRTRKVAPTDKSQSAGQSCCRVCGKFFRYKRSFLKHVLQHEQSSDLCGACGKHLDSAESLEVHLQTHKEENICRDQTEDRRSEAERSDGESDEDWRESEGSGSDDGDSEKDETKDGLRSDSKTKSQGSNKPKRPKNKECKDFSSLKYCCKVCGKSFCYRASFLRHVQEDERDADLCGVCGKSFESEESLRLHLQTYIRTNDCEVCGKHFDGHKQLEMHMRTHTGEKPYICTICGKAFAQNGNLMGHMRVHTGERPYVCSVCGQSFSFKEYMMAHMRIHTGEKPFLCSVCGKGFRQRGTLKTHMMIHTGESTHRCSVCDKKFYKSGALKIHMRSHTGEKPYLCNVCGKSFTASGSLTKHMGVHEGERTHGCGVCGKGFLRKEDLKRHVQTHGDESTQLTSL